MQTVYFISGLGANNRTFSLLDLSFCNPVFINWIAPLSKETLPQYAARLMEAIPDEKPVIVGLSFGGMLATEMGKLNPAAKIILISSNKTSLEFPPYLRTGIYLPLYRWMPGNVQKNSKKLFGWIIGAKGKQSTELLVSIQQEINPKLTNAFIDMILRWKNEKIPSNIIHIHGTADRLLTYGRVKADYTVKGGTHLMVMNNAEEISLILKNIIQGTKI
jgi:pimeloyl-ACP methyl ester carboxylesterase